jgi:DNA-binding SARP family transcriptional activator
MAALSIALLGNFEATLQNQPLPSFRTNKVQALLIYLVTEQSPEKFGAHPREKLLDLLWPGLPERSARHNLRQVIYHLRKAIPDLPRKPDADQGDWGDTVPLLLSNRQTIRLHPAADAEVDVEQFEALIGGTQTHNHIDLHTCHHCQQALGDFVRDRKPITKPDPTPIDS